MNVKEKTEDFEEVMIRGIKNNFFLETGKHIKIVECDRWTSTSNFTFNATIGQVMKMVFDCTGWGWDTTYGTKDLPKAKYRTAEKVFRRAVIDHIAFNNGCKAREIQLMTGRKEHTVLIHSLHAMEDKLDVDRYIRSIFTEIVDYCRKNYYLYKDVEYTKEELMKVKEG